MTSKARCCSSIPYSVTTTATQLPRSVRVLLQPVSKLSVGNRGQTTIFTLKEDRDEKSILELKLLIQLALQQFEAVKELVKAYLQYNENTVERGLFCQALNVVLEVLLGDDLELDDYVVNFRRMFGDPRMDAVLGSVDGSVRFFGLTPTRMKLEGLDSQQRLIDSYKKLHTARVNVAA